MTPLQKASIQAIVNIFETGRIRGSYGALAVLKGDTGHLSYGRSQTTLGGGGLFTLLNRYSQAPGARWSSALRPALARFQAKDFTLDNDANIKTILKLAGDDPVMQATQDQFFDEDYFAPSIQAAQLAGLKTALGIGVVYDSHIQGGWGTVKSRVPSVSASGGEGSWIAKYVDARRNWLLSLKAPLPATVYRMDTFKTLLSSGNLELALPLTVRGITLSEDLLTHHEHDLAA
jgi:chitosanase